MSDGASGRLRLFTASFAAIAATSFCFVLRALVIDDWGRAFLLTETQKGELLSVGLWPFALTIVLLGLLVDRIGFRAVLSFAAGCHLCGLAILLTAQGYWSLYVGTLVMALGNGAVEAAANPLIVTIFHEDKPRWLNRVHAAWPGGMIVGGSVALLLGPAFDWRYKVALMLVPLLVYATMLLRCRFPKSERIAANVRYRAMLSEVGWLPALVILTLMMLEVERVTGIAREATIAMIAASTGIFALIARSAGRPLYLILLILMVPTSITELSTDSWITSLVEPHMTAIGLPGGLVLIYTALLVFGVRIVAGAVIAVLTPPGALAASSALAAVGLVWMSSASGGGALLAAATLYGIGKSFFWGTTLAIGSEQFPRSGALGINVIAGAGMLAAGILGSTLIGTVQDRAMTHAVVRHDDTTGGNFSERYLIDRESAFGRYRALSPVAIARAPAEDRAALGAIATRSKLSALALVAWLPIASCLSYLLLVAWFWYRGGYRAVMLAPTGTSS